MEDGRQRKYGVLSPVKGGKKFWEPKTTNIQHRLLSRVDTIELERCPKGFFILDIVTGFLSSMDSLMLKQISFASENFSRIITGGLLNMDS